MEASLKFEKVEKVMLEEIEELLKEERNAKRNFNIDKQDMLEKIEGLKKEVTDLKSELHKSAAIGTGDLLLLCHILTYLHSTLV